VGKHTKTTRREDPELAIARRFGYTPATWRKARAEFNERMRQVCNPEFREKVERVFAPMMQDRADRAAYAHKLITGVEPESEGAFSKFAESVYGYLRLRGMTPDEIDALSTEDMTRIVEDDAKKRIGIVESAPAPAASPRLVVHANGTVLFDGTTYRFKSERFTEVLAEIARGGGGYVTIAQIQERAKKACRPIGDPYGAIKRGEEEHPELVRAIIEKTRKGYALKVNPSAVRVDNGPTMHR
jgi:hypothetical protein